MDDSYQEILVNLLNRPYRAQQQLVKDWRVGVIGQDERITRIAKQKGDLRKVNYITKVIREVAQLTSDILNQRQQEQYRTIQLNLKMERSEKIRILAELKNVLDQGATKVRFLMDKEGEGLKYYTFILASLLTFDRKWDTKTAFNRLTSFMNAPARYHSQWLSDDREEYNKRVIDRNRKVGNSDEFEGFEVDPRFQIFDDNITIQEDEVQRLIRQFEEELEGYNGGNDYTGDYDEGFYSSKFNSSYGVMGKFASKRSLFTQKNEELEKGSCFYNSMKYYEIDIPEMKGEQTRADIISKLKSLNRSYIIYLDRIQFDSQSLKECENKNIREYTSDSKGKQFLYIGIEPELKIISKFESTNLDSPLIFAYQIGDECDHIYVPDMSQLYTTETYRSIFKKETNSKGKVSLKLAASIMEEKDLINYIYYDLETDSPPKKERFFTPCSMSIHTLLHNNHKLHTFDEKQMIQEIREHGKTHFYMRKGDKDQITELNKTRVTSFGTINYLNGLNVYNEIANHFVSNAINIIIGFNSAGFDNVFLLKDALKVRKPVQVMVHNGLVELQNDKGMENSFKTYDLRRFLGPGTLENHCASYIKDKSMKKKAMKEIFTEINEMYENGSVFEDNINKDNKNEEEKELDQKRRNDLVDRIMLYNNLDVECLALLHCAYMRSNVKTASKCEGILESNKEIEKMISDSVSQAQYVYKYFMKSIVNLNVKPQKFRIPKEQREITRGKNKGKIVNDKEIDETELQNLFDNFTLFSKNKTGGRCDGKPALFNMSTDNGNKIDSKAEIWKSLDVVSLYPFIMMCFNKGFFPIGNLIETKEYQPGKAGIYLIELTQKRENNEMLYFCEKTNGNNWNPDGRKIVTPVTNIEYEELLMKKPHWCSGMEIILGYYTMESIRGYELFKCLFPFMDEKSRQDTLLSEEQAIISKIKKEHPLLSSVEIEEKLEEFFKDTPSENRYNSAARSATKGVMNSLSGKFLQGVKRIETHCVDTDSIGDNKEEQKLLSRSLKKIEMTDREFMLASLKKDKFIFIGMFIYSLSKLYMYQNMYGMDENDTAFDDFVYTDTDSNKMQDRVFKKWFELRGKTKMSNYVWPELIEKKQLSYDSESVMYADTQTKIEKEMIDGTKMMITKTKAPGQFDDEYANFKFDKAIYCGKKEYMCWDSKTFKNKIMLKGVPTKNFLLISEKENNIIGISATSNKPLRIYYRFPNKITVSLDEYEVLDKSARVGATLVSEVNPIIYKDEKIYNMLNEAMNLSKTVDISGKELTDSEKKEKDKILVEQIESIFMKKLDNIGKPASQVKKSFILMKVFRRNIMRQEIRCEYILKQI